MKTDGGFDMKCTDCGSENINDAKFCASCNASLVNVQQNETPLCEICGNENFPSAAFCSNCGHTLHAHIPEKQHLTPKNTKRKKSKKQYAPSLNSRFTIRSAIVAAAVIAFAVLIETKDSRNPVDAQPPAQSLLSLRTMQSIATTEFEPNIYSQFLCPCGKCKDELKSCACAHPNGATEVKAFIDQQISQQTFTVEQVIDMVQEKYGGRKI